MYLFTGKRTLGLKKYFFCHLGLQFWILPKKIFDTLRKVKIFLSSKYPLVGTLNLCLRMPKKMQKTRDESDHSRQRKLPKNALSWKLTIKSAISKTLPMWILNFCFLWCSYSYLRTKIWALLIRMSKKMYFTTPINNYSW